MVQIFNAIKAVEATFCASLSPSSKRKGYAIWTWILTFLIYTTYHLSRKPISVVKNVLNENCSKLVPPEPTNDSHWCDWKPFDEDNSSTLLGILDSTYLFAYAIGMFFSGVIAERSKLNVFLFIGMVSSGILTATFGFGYIFNIHVFWYYLLVQCFGGLMQSTGWPGVVAVMGNWYGKKKRGLIMGIWNSHTSVGNILGTLIASAFLSTNWGFSFIVPGIIMICVGILTLFFLVPEPSVVGMENLNSPVEEDRAEETSDDKQVLQRNSEDYDKPVNFFQALLIPGVIEFSLSLFFAKLVSYTFLYWLPHFIFDSTASDANESGQISTLFDVGGIIGGILAGVLNDTTGMPASTCAVMLIASVGMIFTYQTLLNSLGSLGTMLMLIPVGLLVNGPYALITTAVSAELGTHSSLQGNAKALSTVTSIIDGTGSLGAACGPLIAGVLTNNGNWSNVFYMMIIADILSFVFLTRLIVGEAKILIQRLRTRRPLLI